MVVAALMTMAVVMARTDEMWNIIFYTAGCSMATMWRWRVPARLSLTSQLTSGKTMMVSSHPATKRVRKHDESNDELKRTKRESKKARKKKIESNDDFVDATAISPSIKKEYDNDDVVASTIIATAITPPTT